MDVESVQLGNQEVYFYVESDTQITVEVSPPGGYFKVQTAYGMATSSTTFVVRIIRDPNP